MNASTAALDLDARAPEAIPSGQSTSPARCCGHCGSTYLRRARREAWQRVAFAFSTLRPYECWHCGWCAWLPAPEGASRTSVSDTRPSWHASLPTPGFDAAL